MQRKKERKKESHFSPSLYSTSTQANAISIQPANVPDDANLTVPSIHLLA
jgi:hypothetical protein